MRYTRTLFTIRERFHTKFLAEANNVLNTRNATSLNVTAASAILEGRLVQLA